MTVGSKNDYTQYTGKLFISIVMQETTMIWPDHSLESCDLHVAVFSTLIDKVILGFQDFSMENSTTIPRKRKGQDFRITPTFIMHTVLCLT